MHNTNRQWFGPERSVLRGLLRIDGDDDQTAEGGPGGDTPPAAPAPTFVPSDEFKLFQQTVNGTLGSITETLGYLRAAAERGPSSPAPAVPAGTPISAVQFAEAVQNGDAAVIDAYHRQMRDNWESELVTPLRNTGLGAIADLTRDTTVSRLPYYTRFKKDIDAYVNSLPPQMRLSPAVYKTAHDAVVGANAETLLTEAREAAIRQAADPTPDSARGGARPGRMSGADKVPSVAELMGADAEAALAAKGQTPDDYAKKLGYAGGWAEYAKLAAS